MKRKKPVIPEGAPEGTFWSGGPVEWFSIGLGVHGDDLIPEEITGLLGCKPDKAQQKGEPIYRPDGSIMRIARSGAWKVTIKPGDTDEWDCGEAMLELLHRLPSDLGVWRQVKERYQISFFVGLTMLAKNKGFSLSPTVMSYLGERGIAAGFDIYHDPEDQAEIDHFAVTLPLPQP